MAHPFKQPLLEFAAQRDKKKGRKCSICSLHPDTRAQIEKGYFNHNLTVSAITDWLQNVMELEISRNSVTWHLAKHEQIKPEGAKQ